MVNWLLGWRWVVGLRWIEEKGGFIKGEGSCWGRWRSLVWVAG
jgi:hypothetical protein